MLKLIAMPSPRPAASPRAVESLIQRIERDRTGVWNAIATSSSLRHDTLQVLAEHGTGMRSDAIAAAVWLVQCTEPNGRDARCHAAAQMARADRHGWWDKVWLCAPEPMRKAVVAATPDRPIPLHALMDPDRYAQFIQSWAHEDPGFNSTMSRLMAWNVGMEGSSPIWPTMSRWAAGTDRVMTVAADITEKTARTSYGVSCATRIESVFAVACSERLMTEHPRVAGAATHLEAWSTIADEATRDDASGSLLRMTAAIAPAIAAASPSHLDRMDHEALRLLKAHPERRSLHGYAVARLASIMRCARTATPCSNPVVESVVRASIESANRETRPGSHVTAHPVSDQWALFEHHQLHDDMGFGNAWGACVASMITMSPSASSTSLPITEDWSRVRTSGDLFWSGLTVPSCADVMAEAAITFYNRRSHQPSYPRPPSPSSIACSVHGWATLVDGAINRLSHRTGHALMRHVGLLPAQPDDQPMMTCAPPLGKETALGVAAAALATDPTPLAHELMAVLCA